MLWPDNIVQETIKDANGKRILNLLYKERQLTKQEIARSLGLSIPTVISNVNDLMAEGLVEEAGVADSTGGRKPVIIRFKADARHAFGVDISPSEGRVILTDLDCRILEKDSFPIRELRKYEHIADQVCRIIEEMIDRCSLKRKEILGVGFSLPGTVNEESLVLQNAPNLGIANISLREFADRLNLPVYIENEANAAAYAESALGVVKEMNNLVYVSITKGIGTGIVIKDHLYKGKNKRAGEFGHMTVVAHGKACNCGREGCWEVYASERGLLDDYRAGGGPAVTGIDEVFARVREGEPAAREALDTYLEYLAIGIQNIILMLDPDYVVLGGGLTKYKDVFFEELTRKVFVPNNFFTGGDTKILLSKLGEDASILGAALLPMQTLFFLEEKVI
ncbi:ROK family [Acididesulfobacillus acetoxydans]|uniref:ROK family n=1 Tax=Acididesulfobacillus acetoxydans TaxID=1561005 RepID=A0A8S0W4T6_9FIRM|nr:ROK family transcriptional regulator [Acididesulfobacillus acetoxydans]CAA7602608.1 ROK family [Acididesulfobacillus acetoxydans]CEJ07245.1 Xylose repressor [Acididesulfobacillus acetoxydans]